MYCKNCGKECTGDAEYCSNCGASLNNDTSFTEFGDDSSSSDPNFGREHTFGGAPYGTDLIDVKKDMKLWVICLLCGIHTLFFGWIFGIVLCLLLSVWQDRYREGLKYYYSSNSREAYRIWANAKNYKIAYFIVLGVAIFIKILYLVLILSAFGSIFDLVSSNVY